MLKRKKSLYTDKSNVYKNIRRCNEKMNTNGPGYGGMLKN
jgi:tRNA G26 N,N-dimethylase Trm1